MTFDPWALWELLQLWFKCGSIYNKTKSTAHSHWLKCQASLYERIQKIPKTNFMIVTVQTGQMGLNYSMRGKLERGCWRLFSHTSFILGGWSLLSQFHHTILTLEGMFLGNALTQPLFLFLRVWLSNHFCTQNVPGEPASTFLCVVSACKLTPAYCELINTPVT